jgi:hypothetical protein
LQNLYYGYISEKRADLKISNFITVAAQFLGAGPEKKEVLSIERIKRYQAR